MFKKNSSNSPVSPKFYLPLTILSILLSNIVPGKADAMTLTLLQGEKDGFDTSNGLEQPMPSQGSIIRLRDALGAICDSTPLHPRCQIRNFDENTINKNFLHTFNFAQVAGQITGAELEIRVRGNGSSLNQNDSIGLFFVDSQGVLLPVASWGRSFGTRNDDPGLTNDVWGLGQDRTFSFNLANLPLNPSNTVSSSNLLPVMNSLGFLDIGIQDDTEVDYVELKLTTVPEPLTILGVATAITFGSFFKRQLKFAKK